MAESLCCVLKPIFWDDVLVPYLDCPVEWRRWRGTLGLVCSCASLRMLRLKFSVCGAFTTGHADTDGMLRSLLMYSFGGWEKLFIRELRKILKGTRRDFPFLISRLCPQQRCGRKVCKPFLQESFDYFIYSLKHDYESTLSYEGLFFTLLPWWNFLCVDLRWKLDGANVTCPRQSYCSRIQGSLELAVN